MNTSVKLKYKNYPCNSIPIMEYSSFFYSNTEFSTTTKVAATTTAATTKQNDCEDFHTCDFFLFLRGNVAYRLTKEGGSSHRAGNKVNFRAVFSYFWTYTHKHHRDRKVVHG